MFDAEQKRKLTSPEQDLHGFESFTHEAPRKRPRWGQAARSLLHIGKTELDDTRDEALKPSDNDTAVGPPEPHEVAARPRRHKQRYSMQICLPLKNRNTKRTGCPPNIPTAPKTNLFYQTLLPYC